MAINIYEAAYLMGVSVETVKKMIDAGELLYVKSGGKELDHIVIHESEMTRFQHPWKHIFRLDERINAQQSLVETLKAKINAGLWYDIERAANDANYNLKYLTERVEKIEHILDDLAKWLPGLFEGKTVEPKKISRLIRTLKRKRT